jgi:hypothetical protein
LPGGSINSLEFEFIKKIFANHRTKGRRLMSDTLAVLEAKLAIFEAMYRYCRGLDRMDRECALSAFHPTATVKYPYFEGSAPELMDWLWAVHAEFDIHSHQMSNVIVEFDADVSAAIAESYITATLWQADKKGERFDQVVIRGDATEPVTEGTRTGKLVLICARYFDRWSLRARRWAIDHRRCVVDIQTTSTATGFVGEGRRDHEDGSYALFATRRLT